MCGYSRGSVRTFVCKNSRFYRPKGHMVGVPEIHSFSNKYAVNIVLGGVNLSGTPQSTNQEIHKLPKLQRLVDSLHNFLTARPPKLCSQLVVILPRTICSDAGLPEARITACGVFD